MAIAPSSLLCDALSIVIEASVPFPRGVLWRADVARPEDLDPSSSNDEGPLPLNQLTDADVDVPGGSDEGHADKGVADRVPRLDVSEGGRVAKMSFEGSPGFDNTGGRREDHEKLACSPHGGEGALPYTAFAIGVRRGGDPYGVLEPERNGFMRVQLKKLVTSCGWTCCT